MYQRDTPHSSAPPPVFRDWSSSPGHWELRCAAHTEEERAEEERAEEERDDQIYITIPFIFITGPAAFPNQSCSRIQNLIPRRDRKMSRVCRKSTTTSKTTSTTT
jgi:hypothetical protein